LPTRNSPLTYGSSSEVPLILLIEGIIGKIPGVPALLRTTKREGEKRGEASLPLERYRNAKGVPEDVKLGLPDKVLCLFGVFSNLQGDRQRREMENKIASPDMLVTATHRWQGYSK
jgi:hypothetical protein